MDNFTVPFEDNVSLVAHYNIKGSVKLAVIMHAAYCRWPCFGRGVGL